MSSTAVLHSTSTSSGKGEGEGDDHLSVLRDRLRREGLAESAAGDPVGSHRHPERVANHSATVALEHAEAALDELFAAGVCPGDSRDAVVWIEQLEHLGRRVDAARAELTGAIQAHVLHAPDGHGSARIMVRHVGKLSDAEADFRAKTATAAARLPKVRAAWQAGELSTCAVRILGRIHANQRVAPAMAARQDEFIADARSWSNRTFARKAYRWARLIDEDGPEPRNERDHHKRDARLTQNPWDLSWEVTGFFASTQGAQMREIFDHYLDAEFKADWETAKARVGDEVSNDDLDRTDAQRRADALFRIFQDAAAAPEGAVPPGFVHNIVWSASAFQEMLAAMDADRAPKFDADDLMCRTNDGHDVDPTEAAATSLLGQFRRVVVDAAGVVIDLGRARRFTGSARTAATAARTHCVWPGCHAPASRCEIDHLHEHGRGGLTNPHNAAPLCGLCRMRHKPHYAESVIMPNGGADVLVGAGSAVLCSA